MSLQVQDGGRSVRIFELMQTLVDKTIPGPREWSLGVRLLDKA